MDDSVKQRSKRQFAANRARGDQIARRKSLGIADMQILDIEADSSQKLCANLTQRNVAARLLRDGIGDRVAVAVNVDEIGRNERNQEQNHEGCH